MKEKQERIFWFDLIRGLSAVIVCLGHLRSVFFCDYGQIESKQIWHLPFYFVSGLGHQAVIVFFVLSGYLVGGSVIRKRNEFRWSSYMVSRLSRLWAVLIPALAFTWLVDYAIYQHSPDVLQGEYIQAWSSGPTTDYSANFRTLTANLFFLQTILAPVYGSNGPLWSLANEFWYYVLFPLCIVPLASGIRKKSLFPLLIAAFVIWTLPTWIWYGFVIWLLGAAASYIHEGNNRLLKVVQRNSRWGPIIVWAVFIITLVIARFLPAGYSPRGADFVIGLSFSLLVLFVADLRVSSGILNRAAVWLSEISYSLYLFHFPLVILIGAIVLNGETQQPTFLLLVKYLIALTGIIIVAHIFWFIFERNTVVVRKWMVSLLAIGKFE